MQEVVSEWLERRSAGQRRIVSACSGQGRDLLEALADRDDVAGLSARMVELDPVNVEAARRLAAVVPDGVQVDIVEGDAGALAAYENAVPADLVLMCGVFGNISDVDVQRTVAALPMLCATGATVVWTRHRGEPDLTPSIRSWLADAGFDEESFVAPEGVKWSVGVHVFRGLPQPLVRDAVIFRFV